MKFMIANFSKYWIWEYFNKSDTKLKPDWKYAA